MPRFVVVEALDHQAVALPSSLWQYIPNATVIRYTAEHYKNRSMERAHSAIEELRKASRRYHHSLETAETVSEPTMEITVNAEGEATPLQEESATLYPSMGSLSPLIEAIDTPEEVLDLAEHAAVRFMHATVAESDPNTDEWHPPEPLKRHFGENAWSALGCAWTIVISLFIVGVLYARARRALRVAMERHKKFI